MVLENNLTDMINCKFETDYIQCVDTTWKTIASGLSADTWYRVGIKFECTDGEYEGLGQYKYKVNVNNGAWSSEYSLRNNQATVTNITLQDFIAGSGDYSYFDFLSPDYATAVSRRIIQVE